ncbi:MAG: hypothetical protein J6Y37_10210 [Paludibacteraceae bacterium]|nr:hypothetical protein [Paludibacteraceae bacterium]
MAKRGRKPKENKQTGYFYKREEEAVLAYLSATTAEEKNEIYNTVLRPAFEKMAESIIRRYKLFVPNETFEDTFNDTLSFLITKMSKFEPGQFKAYSYYGTICRNYLIGRIQSYSTSLQRNPSYDVIAEEFNDNLRYSDKPDKNKEIASETVDRLVDRITEMVDNPDDNDLRPNEVKIGKALINLLKNWEYVLSTDASNKLNKNAILLFLREETGLDTKGIRDNMKKFKKEFLLIKNYVIE